MKALQTSKDLRIRVRGCLQNNYFSFKDHRLCVRSLQRKKKKERKKETKFEVTVVEQEEARKETEWKKKKRSRSGRVPCGEGEKFFSLLDKSVSKFCLN